MTALQLKMFVVVVVFFTCPNNYNFVAIKKKTLESEHYLKQLCKTQTFTIY